MCLMLWFSFIFASGQNFTPLFQDGILSLSDSAIEAYQKGLKCNPITEVDRSTIHISLSPSFVRDSKLISEIAAALMVNMTKLEDIHVIVSLRNFLPASGIPEVFTIDPIIEAFPQAKIIVEGFGFGVDHWGAALQERYKQQNLEFNRVVYVKESHS
jgi:hypothetical protein